MDNEGNRIPVIDPETGEQKVGKGNRLQWKRIYVIDNPWNKKEFIQEIRQEWQDDVNDRLELKGSFDRIDCRSYKEQGIEKIPTVHEGRAAREMEINMLHDLIESVSGGIEKLHEKIESVKIEVQQEFVDAFRSITSKAADLIAANKEQKADQENLGSIDSVDSSEIYQNDDDPVDRDDWWDPV